MSSRGQIVSPPNHFQGSIQQNQILDRLQQLRVWQRQQQNQLLLQQQLELRTLKAGQHVTKLRGSFDKDSEETVQQEDDVPVRRLPNGVSDGGTCEGSLQPEGHTVSGSSIHSADSGLLTGQSSAIDVKEKLALDEETEQEREGERGKGDGAFGSSGFLTPESRGFSDDEEGCGFSRPAKVISFAFQS